MKNKELRQYIWIILGAIIFPVGVNLFVAPIKIYNGGVIGVAQIIRTFLQPIIGGFIPKDMDIAGIINFILNIPLMILAYKKISKKFFLKTILSIGVQMVSFSLIPIPKELLMPDLLSNAIVGGLISGIGVGMTLRAGGSSGGTDILGVYYTLKKQGASVGKLTNSLNFIVYLFCAVWFNVTTAIYSIIYAFVLAIVCDKYHHQNIKVSVTIVTRNANVHKAICERLTRGVTYWNGFGGYEDKETHILMTVISKYEVLELKKIVYELDPNAFITMSEGLTLVGNFEKRLF